MLYGEELHKFRLSGGYICQRVGFDPVGSLPLPDGEVYPAQQRSSCLLRAKVVGGSSVHECVLYFIQEADIELSHLWRPLGDHIYQSQFR